MDKWPQSKEEWRTAFIEAWSEDQSDTLAALCSRACREVEDLQGMLNRGVNAGNVDLVRYLTVSEAIRAGGLPPVDIHKDKEDLFVQACHYGQLDLIQWMSTDSQLRESGLGLADIHADGEAGLRWACRGGHLDVVKFLTISPELKTAGQEWARIEERNNLALKWACHKGHVNIVEWLMTSTELKDAGVPWAGLPEKEDQDDCIRYAYECDMYTGGHWKVLEFLTMSVALKKVRGKVIDIDAVLEEKMINWAIDTGDESMIRWWLFSYQEYKDRMLTQKKEQKEQKKANSFWGWIKKWERELKKGSATKKETLSKDIIKCFNACVDEGIKKLWDAYQEQNNLKQAVKESMEKEKDTLNERAESESRGGIEGGEKETKS